MSRGYPRFLLSFSHNTIDRGLFIVQTIEPKIICKVHFPTTSSIPNVDFENFFDYELKFRFTLIHVNAKDFNSPVNKYIDAMAKWFNNQIIEGYLQIDSYQSVDYNMIRAYTEFSQPSIKI